MKWVTKKKKKAQVAPGLFPAATAQPACCRRVDVPSVPQREADKPKESGRPADSRRAGGKERGKERGDRQSRSSDKAGDRQHDRSRAGAAHLQCCDAALSGRASTAVLQGGAASICWRPSCMIVCTTTVMTGRGAAEQRGKGSREWVAVCRAVCGLGHAIRGRGQADCTASPRQVDNSARLIAAESAGHVPSMQICLAWHCTLQPAMVGGHGMLQMLCGAGCCSEKMRSCGQAGQPAAHWSMQRAACSSSGSCCCKLEYNQPGDYTAEVSVHRANSQPNVSVRQSQSGSSWVGPMALTSADSVGLEDIWPLQVAVADLQARSMRPDFAEGSRG